MFFENETLLLICFLEGKNLPSGIVIVGPPNYTCDKFVERLKTLSIFANKIVSQG